MNECDKISDNKQRRVKIKIKEACLGCSLSRRKWIRGCLKHALTRFKKGDPQQKLTFCRRCSRTLNKLKADLQGLGLTRRQVHRGLVQLSTKPRVVLTRLPSCGRYGIYNLLEDQHKKSSESCRRSASFEHSRLKNEKVHVPGTAGSSNKEDIKCDKNPEKLSIRVSINNTRGLFIPEKGSKLTSDPAAIFHSIDKALEQFDKLMYSKVNKHEMSPNKQTSATVAADSSTCVSRHKTWVNKNDISLSQKSRNDENISGNNNDRRRQRTPELTVDKVGTSTVRVPDQSKKNRIKLNLISCYGRKANAKSEIYKKAYVDYVKPNVVKKLDSGKKCIDNKVKCTVNSDKFLKPESNGNVLAGTEVAKKKENLCKRKLHETLTCDVSQGREKICALGDESKEFNKNKTKKLRSKFRIYFGDCISISEDEQDHDILEKRFKRRREKNSVESCDSGMCVSESRMTKCIKTLTGTKKSILDAVTCERLNEEVSRNITIRNVADKWEKNTESSKAADLVDSLMSAMKVANTEKQNKMRTKDKNTDKEDTRVEKLIGATDRSTITSQFKTTTSMTKMCLEKETEVELDVQLEVQSGGQPTVQLEVQSKVQPEVQLDVQSNVQPDVQPKVQLNVQPNVQLEVQSKVQPQVHLEVQPDVEPKVRIETEESQLKADANEKSQALFETQERIKSQLESEIEAEKKSDIDSTCETLIYDSNKDTDNDSVQTQEYNSDMRDLTELLNMSFDETCHITLNENVVSITEPVEKDWRQNIVNRNIDKNGNLKVLPEVQTRNNQVTIKQEMLDHIEENNNSIEKDMLLLFYGKERNVEDVSTNNTSSLPHIEEPIVQDPKLNTTTEKIDNQPNRIFQSKLRVLSSAELGSRWCPTPINAITSPVAQTCIEPMSEDSLKYTTPVAVSSAVLPTERLLPTIFATTVPISTPSLTNRIDVERAEPTDIIFIKILNLIQSLRLSSRIFKLDYNKLLLTEFEKLRSVANTDNYIALTEGVLCVLNTKLLVNPQLSLLELFSYAPSIKVLYLRTIKGNTEQPNLTATTICNPMITNQNVCCNQQLSQNSSATPVQTTLQNLLLSSNLKSRQRPINVSSKQSQQNIYKNDAAQLQNNVLQNNVTVPSVVVSNQNVHQQKYQTSKQRPFAQQKVSNSYGVKQKSVTNTYTTQSFPIQPSVIQSVGGSNVQGGIQIPAQVINSSFINQQHLSQCAFVPQVSTSYNANPLNYSVQQTKPMHANMPNVCMPLTDKQHQTRSAIAVQPTYISQNIQAQNIPHVPVNYIPKPVQTMFSTNIPHSVPNYMQQNQNINQRIPAPVQLKVPQNHMPEQPPSSQHMHNAYSNKIAPPVVPAKKRGVNIPVSLESTTKMFDVLKYLSDYQKVVLLKQLDFYFGCTAWLQQQFTSGQWQQIHMQRSLLLHFQTLLKHLVEKSTKDLSNKSQASAVETNIFASIKIDMPKTVQSIVRENEENEGIRYNVDVSKINKDCVTCEENGNVMTVLTEAEEECNKETDKSQNEALQILDQEGGQKDKSIEEKSLQDGNPVGSSTLVIRETLDINVHQKDELEKESGNVSVGAHDLNISRQSINELEKIIDNLSQIVGDKTIADLKLSNQDVSQQSGLHLVTVETSPESEQITVINTNTENGKELISDNPVEGEKLQDKPAIADNLSPLKNTVCGMSIMSLPKTSQGIKFNTDTDKSLSQEPTISQIADVRSISLETLEKMDCSNNLPPSSAEEKMEEEEIKVCLFCGGPSTVACSICLEAKYCSKDCFELHWVDHYKDCIPVESIYL